MAHYAFIKDNIVTEVITGREEDDTESLPEGFDSWEAYYLTKRSDQDACKRTSYNTYANTHNNGGIAFRGNYAGIGHTYDSVNDVFYIEQPYASWTISEDTNWLWQAPIDRPELTDEQYSAGAYYQWNESAYQNDNNTGWDLIE